MARRRRTSAFEDLIIVLTRLPWWVCLVLGLIAWLILSPIADRPTTAPSNFTPDDVGSLMAGQVLWVFAMYGQYLIPFACVLAAIGSVASRIRRKKLVADVQAATQPGKAIDGLNWRQFEQLVGEAFRRQGYSITETGGNGPDGGVDLILRKDGEKYLVQCKHWRSLKVGVAVIREFFGAMAAEGAASGFVVISGQFTKEAAAFASGRNIQLIDGVVSNVGSHNTRPSEQFLNPHRRCRRRRKYRSARSATRQWSNALPSGVRVRVTHFGDAWITPGAEEW